MRGIAGIAGRRARLEVSAVKRMTEALARRGPDGEGVELWPTAVLGHRRLAIFDLSEAGCQPMVSPDGKIGVVFNGAIYNFKELRRELEGRGYTFRSATDTEVLIHGYREWGIEGLVQRLRGMSLPPELRLRGYRLKALLRALAAKRIGPETSRRRKMGFGIPVLRWLAGRWYESARALWEDSIAQREGWANARPILRQLQESRPTGAAPLQLWYLLVLELWLRREQASADSTARSRSVAASG